MSWCSCLILVVATVPAQRLCKLDLSSSMGMISRSALPRGQGTFATQLSAEVDL